MLLLNPRGTSLGPNGCTAEHQERLLLTARGASLGPNGCTAEHQERLLLSPRAAFFGPYRTTDDVQEMLLSRTESHPLGSRAASLGHSGVPLRTKGCAPSDQEQHLSSSALLPLRTKGC